MVGSNGVTEFLDVSIQHTALRSTMSVLHLCLLTRHTPPIFRFVRHQVRDRQGFGLEVTTPIVNHQYPVVGGGDGCTITPRILNNRARVGVNVCIVRTG